MISIPYFQSKIDKSKDVSPVIFFISKIEEFLYLGITSKRNSGSTFFIEIDILVLLFILAKYLENQDKFKSLKYGGEKVTTWDHNVSEIFTILSIYSSLSQFDGADIDRTFTHISSDNHLIYDESHKS